MKIEYSGGTYDRPDGEDGDIVFTFKKAEGTIKFPGLAKGSVLLVGGGGAGGSGTGTTSNFGAGGGGGAGGFVTADDQKFQPGVYSIFVGAGGVAGAQGTVGGDGGESAIQLNNVDLWRAYGGGGGGASSDGRGNGTDGKKLASGGGGSQDYDSDTKISTSHNGGAGLDGQGCAGGKGNAGRSGGGGGGAGANGADAPGANAGADGGEGRPSAIACKAGEDPIYYAGGGGSGNGTGMTIGKGGKGNGPVGSTVGYGNGGGGSASTLAAATPGADGFGGGGGGGTLKAPGAKGGSGVVIIRITSALPNPIKPPVPKSFDYTGENRVTIEKLDPGLQLVGVGVGLNQTNAVNAGDYYFTVKPDEGMEWDASIGGGNYETNLYWKIAAIEVETPVARDSKTGSSSIFYNGENHVVLFPTNYYTYAEGSVTNATDGGTYEYTAVLANPAGATNYVWKGYSEAKRAEPYRGTWRIGPAVNSITELSVLGWKSTGEPNDPVCKATWGEDTAQYRWMSATNGAEWTEWFPRAEWKAQAPRGTGAYKLQAIVEETNNWEATEVREVTFTLWDNPESFFSDHVDVTVTSADTAELKNVKVTLTLAEDKPKGFSYSRIATQADLSVILVDDIDRPEDGTPVPFEVTTWDTRGESTLTVCLPEIAAAGEAKLLLYWALKPGFVAPLPPDMPAGATTSSKLTTAYGLVSRGGELINYWTEYPELTKSYWDEGTDPGELIAKAGKLEVGGVTNYFYDVAHPEVTYSDWRVFTAAGSYRAVFDSTEPEKYASLTYTIDFRIVQHKSYSDLGDSQSGRILLMNNDIGDETHPKVTYQGYYHLSTRSETTDTFWELLNEEPVSAFNLKAGTECMLWTANYGRRLWHLVDCRHGNNFPAGNDTSSLDDSANYLNWSPTSRRITANNTTVRRRDVGQLVMRNIENAAVYSSCFENGIGTIYFDAVNSRVPDEKILPEHFRLKVEFATNCVEIIEGRRVLNAKPPTDENVMEVVTNITERGLVVSTNLYGLANWQTAEIVPYLRDGTDDFVRQDPARSVDLGVQNGGTVNNFYRMLLPLGIAGPVRFRIVRETHVPFATLSEDQDGFILLDNIIVSEPPRWARLATPGVYDETKSGKQTLGFEGTFDVPYPSMKDELYGRGVPEGPIADPAELAQMIVAAKMHYRWRYRSQRFEPAKNRETDTWNAIDLLPSKNFMSSRPLDLPKLPGDVEFWYETNLEAPFYEYVDYSGYALGVPGYTEEISATTNRTSGCNYPSGGTDWFVRLREGRDDYGLVKAIMRPAGNTNASAQVEVRMELLSDRVWRGYLQTLDPVAGGVWEYRFEGIARRSAEDPGLDATDRWIADHDYTLMPVSCRIRPSGADEWAKMPSLAKTGYYMFQLDDETMSVSVVHADYMNFNGWTDAKGTVYKGNSTEDAKKSGVSPKKRDYDEPFAGWTDTPATNPLWQERFYDKAWPETIRNYNGYSLYKTLSSAMTLNGWTVGQGQFVASRYQDLRRQSGVALQMEGQGKGYIQLVGAPEAPRGLESLSFTARIAQTVQFENFSTYYGEVMPLMKDYTFITRVNFDRCLNLDFSGNASLSLVAYHLPFKGCYEARWEQLDGEWTGSGESMTCTGIDRKSQRLRLYRWNGMKPTLLAEIFNTSDEAGFEIPANDNTQAAEYLPFYISVMNRSEGTWVVAGVCRKGMTLAADDSNYNAENWFSVAYLDKSGSRLTAGTFGVGSANCPGVFAGSEKLASPIGYTTDEDLKDHKISFDITSPKYLNDDICNGLWGYNPDLLEYKAEPIAGNQYSMFVGKSPEQTVDIYLAPAGTTTFPDTPAMSVPVKDFGVYNNPGKLHRLNFWKPEDCTVKLAAGGTVDDVRTDVVIDNIEIRQWRGDTYGGRDTVDFIVPDDGYNWRTNFIFTTAWITNGAVRLSAKRTRTSDVASLRSPLLDGGGNPARGIGLGMISVQYEYATDNASLDLQIATNVTGTARVDESQWITVTNWNFATMTPEQRKNKILSAYLGLHGVQGLMRVRVAPNLVEDVKSITNQTLFGEVDITRIFCCDEPTIDLTCWWGWNLRTTDEDDRSYLPDKALAPNGLSLSLNNSASRDIVQIEKESYKQHMPFVQTPTFGSDIVGEITFRARKDDLSPSSQMAELAVYGAKSGNISLDSEWKLVKRFVISNTTYTTYSCRTPVGDNYRAFRFGVTGVPDVNASSRGPAPTQGATPVRVMIDEVVVSQAIRPVMGFKYVYPFRNHLSDNLKVEDILSCDEQPMLGESWSVQAEIEVRQLPDEIDLVTPGREPRVYFHWFPETTPWGRDNWGTRADAKVAELVRADGEQMVFRGGFGAAPRAVADPLTGGTFEVAQYSADVVYWNTSGQCLTNSLTEAEWKRPSWYDPLNLNAKYASWKSFAAYTVLEGVAPKRTWINEVNLFDGLDAGGSATGGDNQYIEVAAPMSQAIDGWYLEYVSNSGVTNVLCTFGENGVSSVKTMNSTNEYVFFSVQSPRTRDAKTLDVSKGEVDGTWENFDSNGGALDDTLPLGLRLIRPSGIVEQEIVLEGTNSWHDTRYEARFSATNMVVRLNDEAAAAGGVPAWYFAGNEYLGTAADSLGAIEGIGATKDEWTSPMLKTPGRVNVGQNVPLDYVIYPNGALMMVYSYLDGSGHVRQTFGDVVEEEADAMAVSRKGGEGTNITYFIDRWWEVKELATNGVPVPGWTGRTDVQRFTAGIGQSNNVSVTMSVQPRADVRELIGEGNRYEAAILDWLGKGKTRKGKFENPGKIQLGEYWPYLQDPKFRGRRKLSLTEEYWLDIDPTSSNWVLHAGFANGTDMLPHEVGRSKEDPSRGRAVRMGLYMAITNVNETSPKYGQNWSPYMLRGLAPGETSLDYSETSPNDWTSVTFKVTGDIQNGMPMRKRWIPMRWFTFHEGSFGPDHTAVIDMIHPYESDSAGAASGWRDYIGCPVFYSWNIDTRLNPITVEILAPESKLVE